MAPLRWKKESGTGSMFSVSRAMVVAQPGATALLAGVWQVAGVEEVVDTLARF